MRELDRQDRQHLEAAEGWFELGNHLEANEELENISPRLKAHPEVLDLRFRIYEAIGHWQLAAEVAGTLCKLRPKEPLGVVYLGRALHGLNCTSAAVDFLVQAADNFSGEPEIPYDIARYCCRIGKLQAALKWLERAFRWPIRRK